VGVVCDASGDRCTGMQAADGAIADRAARATASQRVDHTRLGVGNCALLRVSWANASVLPRDGDAFGVFAATSRKRATRSVMRRCHRRTSVSLR
jgi:hypothetical protein